MNDTEPTVLIKTDRQNLFDRIDRELERFTVLRSETLEQLNEAVKNHQIKNAEPIGAVILDLRNSIDWMAFELIKTGYPSLPCFVVLEDDNFENAEKAALKLGAMAVFKESRTAAIAALVETSVRNNLRRPGELDHNSEFLSVFGAISRELGRLHGEFTETALRTLPQSVVGDDTRSRLRDNLSKLQSIRITP